MTRAATVLCLLLLASAASAQDLGTKAPPQKGPIAVVNGTVHPVSGPAIEKGWVLFDKGRITGVGAMPADLPDGAEIVDATGRHVYPGLVAPFTNLGLVEIGAVRATRDFDEVGAVTPEVRAVVAVNPDSTLLPVARSNGILTAGTFPSGGAIPGRAGVIRLDGWTWEDMTVEADAGVVVSWPNPSARKRWWDDRSEEDIREEARKHLVRIRDAFDRAKAWAVARKADPKTPIDLRWEGMRSAFERRVFFQANEYDQIVGAARFAKKHGLRAVIVGGRDAGRCLEVLRECDAAVILTGSQMMPKRADSHYAEVFRLASVLEKSGIEWCMASGQGASSERNLPYAAGMAVAHGLPREAAIRSITLSPAKILGVDDRLGSLEPGKFATLIVTDGDPLEITTNVRMAFIDGRRIDLANKQTVLAEKYREKYRQLGQIPRTDK